MWFIQIKTGGASGANTQANVGLRLLGASGAESPNFPSYYRLDNRSEDRQRKRLDTYYPGDSGLEDIGGRVAKMFLYFDPMDDVAKNAWQLDWVRIGPGRPQPDLEVRIGQKWKFGRWLTERGWYSLGDLIPTARFSARRTDFQISSSLEFSVASATLDLPVFKLRPITVEG